MERFLAAPHLMGKFLPEFDGVLQRLATRFSEETSVSSEVELVPLAADERTLLLKIASELYSLTEIQRLAAGQPPYGECQTDGTWHTQAPG